MNEQVKKLGAMFFSIGVLLRLKGEPVEPRREWYESAEVFEEAKQRYQKEIEDFFTADQLSYYWHVKINQGRVSEKALNGRYFEGVESAGAELEIVLKHVAEITAKRVEYLQKEGV